MLAQLDEAISEAPCGLTVDESADVSDDAHLFVYVQFFNEGKKQKGKTSTWQ